LSRATIISRFKATGADDPRSVAGFEVSTTNRDFAERAEPDPTADDVVADDSGAGSATHEFADFAELRLDALFAASADAEPEGTLPANSLPLF